MKSSFNFQAYGIEPRFPLRMRFIRKFFISNNTTTRFKEQYYFNRIFIYKLKCLKILFNKNILKENDLKKS